MIAMKVLIKITVMTVMSKHSNPKQKAQNLLVKEISKLSKLRTKKSWKIKLKVLWFRNKWDKRRRLSYLMIAMEVLIKMKMASKHSNPKQKAQTLLVKKISKSSKLRTNNSQIPLQQHHLYLQNRLSKRFSQSPLRMITWSTHNQLTVLGQWMIWPCF